MNEMVSRSLDEAIDNNNERLVKFLLSYVNYDILLTYTESHRNILHRACGKKNANTNIIKAILERGINVNVDDEYGETALHLACKRGNKEVVQLLIDYGIDINYVNEARFCGYSAIYYALNHKCTDVLELLLKNGANIFKVSSDSFSLYTAAEDTPNAAKLILKHAVNLNSKKTIDWTPLSYAIFDADLKTMQELIANGHEIDILCAYAAVCSSNSKIFEPVWENITSELVSSDSNFMIHVFDSWYYDTKIDQLWLILSREDIDLHLETCGRSFSFFINHGAQYVFEESSRDELVTIMQHLYARGLRLSESDAECIVGAIFNYRWMTEVIVETFLPKITRQAFITACSNDCDRDLLQYCLEADFYALFDADDFNWSLDTIQYYLSRFTVQRRDKNVIASICDDSDENIEILDTILESLNLKSLVELSRDVIRKKLSERCKDTRHMFQIFDHLNLPARIRGIIQCKEPVNRLLLNSD